MRTRSCSSLNRRTKEVFDEHKRQIDNLTSLQSELALRAWHEVETTKFKDMLAIHQSEYKARTEDFCKDNLQELESNVDSYDAEHHQGTQV